MKFLNKVVLISGGSSGGIGGQAAVDFASEGAKVVILGRNEERLQKTKQECLKARKECKVHIIIKDLAVFDNLKPIIDETIVVFGQLDVLVNCAAYFKEMLTLDLLNLDHFTKTMDLNVRAPLFLCKFAAEHLKKTKGCIVNISSTTSDYMIPPSMDYSVSKAALNHATRVLANDLIKSGVRVNTVSPGVTKTNMHQNMQIPEQVTKMIEDMQPFGGMLSPKSISDAILFLSSDGAKHITGIKLQVDGGFGISH